jgi:hypothetical protein
MMEVYVYLDHIKVQMVLVLKMDLNNQILKILLVVIISEEKMNVNIVDMIHIN